MLAEPVITASGVRRSCDTELSSAFCSRSASARSRASSACSARRSRSKASASWLANASTRWTCCGGSFARSAGAAMPRTPTAPRAAASGKYDAAAPGSVSVPHPARSPLRKLQWATARSDSSRANASSAPAAARTRPSSSGRKTAVGSCSSPPTFRAAAAASSSVVRDCANSRLSP